MPPAPDHPLVAPQPQGVVARGAQFDSLCLLAIIDEPDGGPRDCGISLSLLQCPEDRLAVRSLRAAAPDQELFRPIQKWLEEGARSMDGRPSPLSAGTQSLIIALAKGRRGNGTVE